jgi:hypothetical protein
VASIRINRSAIRLEEKLQRGNADERHGRILPRLARSLAVVDRPASGVKASKDWRCL